MDPTVERYLNEIEFKAEPGDRASITAAERLLGVTFPADLVELYQRHSALNGSVGDDAEDEDAGGIVIFYPVAELAENNEGYEFPGYTPGFVLIGTNGGGEAYALDYRTDPPVYVVVPFIGRDYDTALLAGSSLADFLTSVAEQSFWGRAAP